MKQQLTDNVGLFNEINPVYISMNMGRPSTPFFDDYVTQDQFRLIQRDGVYLMGDRWMMINFLKCDYLTQQANTEGSIQQNISGLTQDTEAKEKSKAPMQYILRVIAFENETSSQFAFDLNFEDLLTLMQGNIKLLEDENTHDLCQILLNNLALIKREKVDKKGNTVYEIHKQVGVAFVADEDKDFDAQGNLDVGNGEYTIWLRKKTSQNGNPITVASLSPKKESASESTEKLPVVDSTPDLDDVPF